MASPNKQEGRKKKDDKIFKPVLGNPEDFYVKARIYMARRIGLLLLVGLLTFTISLLISSNSSVDGDWRTIAVPIILLGAMALLFPQTEDWVYRPWQAAAQQVERHYYDI